MTTEVEKSGKDTWVNSSNPDLNRVGNPKLGLESGAAQAFLAVVAAIPEDAIVTAGTYGVFAAGASAGARVLTLRTPDDEWRPGQITWTDRPGVTGPSATANVDVLADEDLIEFEVRDILQAVVDGTVDPNGFRLSTDSAVRHKVYSYDSDHPPVLTYSYAIPGDPPTDLAPSSGAVGTDKPWLTWTSVDVDDADLASVRVQIDAGQDTVSPDFDSGWLDSEVPEVDLSTTLFGGLTDGVETFWRANVIDSAGTETGWSDWVPLLYRPQGVLSITSPNLVGEVYDVTPDITWVLASATQKQWQVRLVLADDPKTILYDSGVRTGTAVAHTIPKGVLVDESATYRAEVRTWDTRRRETIKGSPAYVRATRDFVLADGATGAPYQFWVHTMAAHPEVVLSWKDIGAPDSYTIIRDGEVIESLLEPADLLVSGTTYRWRDWTAQPRVEHTYQVRAVLAKQQSQKTPPQKVTPTPEGVWLIDPETETWICVSGVGGMDSWGDEDAFAVYMPLGADKPVKITSGMSARPQSFDGEINEQSIESRTIAEQVDNLRKLAKHPDRILRQVTGDRNRRVLVANLVDTTHPDLLGDEVDKVRVTWTFWNYGSSTRKY